MEKIAALVPMRHHSQRVKGKNYRDLAGKPLYQHILSTLGSCPEISEIVIKQEVQEQATAEVQETRMSSSTDSASSKDAYTTKLVEDCAFIVTEKNKQILQNPIKKKLEQETNLMNAVHTDDPLPGVRADISTNNQMESENERPVQNAALYHSKEQGLYNGIQVKGLDKTRNSWAPDERSEGKTLQPSRDNPTAKSHPNVEQRRRGERKLPHRLLQ